MYKTLHGNYIYKYLSLIKWLQAFGTTYKWLKSDELQKLETFF